MRQFSKLLTATCLLLGSAACIASPRVDLERLYNNPADASRSRDNSEHLLYAYGEIYFDDRDDLLDKALEVKEEGEDLEARSRGFLLIPGDERELVAALEALDGTTTSLRSRGALMLATAKDSPWHYQVGSELRGTARFYYDEDDENRLRFAGVTGVFGGPDLESYMNVSAVLQNHVGLNYHFRVPSLPNTEFGVLAKIQVISLMERRIDYDDYEQNQVFDWDTDINSHLQLNADLGLRHQIGHVGLQLLAKDLYTEDMSGSSGSVYKQRNRLLAGFDYRRSWGQLVVMADLVPRASFVEVPDRRDVTVSSSLRLSRRFELILGYNYVEHRYERDTGNAGLRYTLGRSLRAELSMTAAGKRELGGHFSLQLPL